MYYKGRGVQQDYNKAAYLLAKAAEQGGHGDTEAQILLASMYDQGKGVPQDHDKVDHCLTLFSQNSRTVSLPIGGDDLRRGRSDKRQFVSQLEELTSARNPFGPSLGARSCRPEGHFMF